MTTMGRDNEGNVSKPSSMIGERLAEIEQKAPGLVPALRRLFVSAAYLASSYDFVDRLKYVVLAFETAGVLDVLQRVKFSEILLVDSGQIEEMNHLQGQLWPRLRQTVLFWRNVHPKHDLLAMLQADMSKDPTSAYNRQLKKLLAEKNEYGAAALVLGELFILQLYILAADVERRDLRSRRG